MPTTFCARVHRIEPVQLQDAVAGWRCRCWCCCCCCRCCCCCCVESKNRDIILPVESLDQDVSELFAGDRVKRQASTLQSQGSSVRGILPPLPANSTSVVRQSFAKINCIVHNLSGLDKSLMGLYPFSMLTMWLSAFKSNLLGTDFFLIGLFSYSVTSCLPHTQLSSSLVETMITLIFILVFHTATNQETISSPFF